MRRATNCTHCQEALGEARVVAHVAHHDTPSGEFHIECYPRAALVHIARTQTQQAQRLHADLETVCEAEWPKAHRMSS